MLHYHRSGTIVVCGDYTGNLKKIAKMLTSLNFNSGLNNGREQVGFSAQDKLITLDGFLVHYPTAFPCRESLILKDGRQVLLEDADDSVINEWESENEDYDYLEYSLGELSNFIAPLLTKGTIEIVAIGHDMNQLAIFERLIIRSDGSAERHRHFRQRVTSDENVEYFQPRVTRKAA